MGSNSSKRSLDGYTLVKMTIRIPRRKIGIVHHFMPRALRPADLGSPDRRARSAGAAFRYKPSRSSQSFVTARFRLVPRQQCGDIGGVRRTRAAQPPVPADEDLCRVMAQIADMPH